MKKLLFGIFAHPDDEAFGPSATLIKEVEKGTELHLICATGGEHGVNSNSQDVAVTRLQEWQTAANLIGATTTHHLGFEDGKLCNAIYHEVADKIETIVRETCASQPETCEVHFMTFDMDGLTGHLDHIAVSSITTFLFYKLQSQPLKNGRVKELAYYCYSEKQQPAPNLNYFVFWPQGKPDAAINRRVAVRAYIDKKYAVMKAHHSQKKDAQQFMDRGEEFHSIDNFYVITGA